MSEEQIALLTAGIKSLEDYQRMSGTQSATFVLGLDSIRKVLDVDA
jgi:hypothetical protein